MNKNILKGLIYLTIILCISCSKQLETTPELTIDASNALKTSQDVKVALIGAYKDFGDDDLFGGRPFLEGDLLANNNEVNWSGTYEELTQIYNKAIPRENVFVANFWLAAYQTINDVNNVLAAISVVTAKDSARISGEAKFLRGASYFELIKKFGKAWNDGSPANNPGVPLVLTPTITITEQSKVKRNTVAEVYAQVIADLTDAEAKLPETNGFYATKAAAAAMLARVYLQKRDYTNALNAADRAITNSGATLTNSYAEAFGTTNTSEDIFAIQVTSTSGLHGYNEFYSSSQRGDIQIEDKHLNLYEPGDDRLDLFYDDAGSTYTGKFEELYGNVHIIRLAEMLLVRAECNFRLGTAVGEKPLDDINTIRGRVKLKPIMVGQLTLNKILLERKLELAFEGIGLDDAKRLEQNIANFS